MVVKSHLKFKLNYSSLNSKPSLYAGVLSFLLLTSCGSFKIPFMGKKTDALSKESYEVMSHKDFSDQLASLKPAFLNTPGVNAVKVNPLVHGYIRGLLNEIIANNEIFFRELKKGEITVIENDAPLHFSLSRGEIFLSTGLITKYLKHESMLVGILSYELVRSEKLLYPKETIIPVGYLPLERILRLSRLTIDEKMEVHKWAHHVTIRSGYDGEYYLSWLQVQNRNTADFILQVGDASLINQEEARFKAFLIKNTLDENVPVKKNSSKNFYTLINRIRDGV
jgi:hypothetical protein